MELTPVTYLIVLPLVFLAGFVDSVAGGGGIISLPAYLMAGIPAHLAAGTNKVVNGCGTLTATTKYFRSGKILLRPAIAAAVGALMTYKKPNNPSFYAKEGFVCTALGWILMSAFGCVPFMLTGEIPSFIDAMFEMVSGFTTTGASVVLNVEELSHCTNMWRCFSHWIGGMGILVFLLAVLPLVGGSNMQLMKAESPGPSVGKLVPKVRFTARILYVLYVALTVLQVLVMLLGGMTFYEALCTSFGTAGTGGFGIYGDSIAGFSPFLQWAITIFMIAFGVNFNVYFLLYMRRPKDALHCEEMHWYLGIIVAAALMICANAYDVAMTLEGNLRQSFFQVASIITTTGFATTDFNLWPGFSHSILVLLMFIGACAGSTGGGIKVSRLLILGKTLGKELKHALHPQVVAPARMDGKLINHETIRATNVFLAAYIFIFAASLFFISLDGFDMVTNFTAIAATLNNIGPGLNQVGPMMNFGGFSNPAKLVMIFDMLAGRLEIFPMLVLFLPDTWRKF